MKREGFQLCIDHSTELVPCGFAIKKMHTIVEKWPFSLKLKYGQPGAQEEFQIVRSSEHTLAVRYVEWKMNGRETWSDLLRRFWRLMLSMFAVLFCFVWFTSSKSSQV